MSMNVTDSDFVGRDDCRSYALDPPREVRATGPLEFEEMSGERGRSAKQMGVHSGWFEAELYYDREPTPEDFEALARLVPYDLTPRTP